MRVKAISAACKEHGLSLHMDGARFANACASLRCTPADLTWKSGVDVLCFGGTKNGMAVGEAVIFFDKAQAVDFDYRCKQAGQPGVEDAVSFGSMGGNAGRAVHG